MIDKEPILWGGIGEKKSNNNTQWYMQDRIYDSRGVALCLCTDCNPYYLIQEENENMNEWKIRKLTGKEAYRLMDFDDIDADRARNVISESLMYHTAGDSICVGILEQLFLQLGIERTIENDKK